jgi:cell division protein FtsI/penicillin-binding protein 2
MGRTAGFAALAALLQRFFFNAPPFSDQFCRFTTGKFDARASDDFGLASLAAGLDGVSLTTVHAAVLAAVFSQAGQFFPPYLIDDAKNLLGLGFYRHESRPQRLLADDLNFLRVKKAMAAVVEDEKGTGRRARSQAVRMAIKTGTAAGPAGGLDSVIIGFFPYEKPRYAFAFRLEGGGRAEINGALVLQGLLHILYPE